MAKTQASGPSYSSVVSEIRAGRIAPVYLLSGEEPYYLDAIAELLQERVVADEEARDFDQYIFYGADSDTRAVADAARRYPVMGERQLVMLKEAQTLSGAVKELEKLAPYVAKPVPTTVLVIVYKGEALKGTTALVKAAKKSGAVVFTSPKIRDWQLGPYIADYCKSKGLKIDDKSQQMLRDFIGADLSRLFGEIDKLGVAGGGRPITPELIEENIGISKDFNNFELVSAVARRDYVKSMQIVDYFERNPKQNPVVKTVSQLFRYFAQLMMAHYSPVRTESGIMRHLGYSASWQMRDVSDGLRRYSAMSVMRIIHAIRVMDARSKGVDSAQKDTALLRQLIYEIFTL